MVLLPSFAVEVIRHCNARQAGFSSGNLKELGECGEIAACRRDGSRFPAEMSLAVLDDCGSGGAVSLAILRDVGEKKRAVAQVEYLATHDSLTGLPNRRLFFERLARAIDVAEQDEKLMALMFIDLDGFKQVNDVLGHAAGDELLRVVASRLRSHLRAADTVARLGGDEFAVIVEQLTHVDPISELASVLLRTVAEPIVLDGATATVSASIGIVICPLEAKSCKQMMVDADRAMYAAKAAGKGRFLFYAADMMAGAQNDGNGAAPERREATPARLELCA
jgi:diguanylate cyclase (GGDEF)-like protein